MSVRISELLGERIHNVIQARFLNQDVNEETFKAIHEEILGIIKWIFAKSKHKLTNNAMGWLANQYFKSIELNGQKLGALVIFNDYDLSTMSRDDILLLHDLFNEKFCFEELQKEFNKRIAS